MGAIAKHKKIQSLIPSKLKTLVFERHYWEKENHGLIQIFLNHLSDKELLSRIYKENSRLNHEKINHQLETYTKICIDTSPKKINDW